MIPQRGAKGDISRCVGILRGTRSRSNVMEKCKTFEPLMEGHCFLKNKLVCFKSCHLSSCFDEILFMHQVVLSFNLLLSQHFS